MTIRVAINGYGRIGRNILRAHYENKAHADIQIVAINDLGDVNTNAHLTRYDTTHGKFPGEVSVSGNDLIVNGDKIRVVAERDPKNLPWRELKVDIVLECTGFFTSKEKASAHLEAGAKKVLISAPATGVDALMDSTDNGVNWFLGSGPFFIERSNIDASRDEFSTVRITIRGSGYNACDIEDTTMVVPTALFDGMEQI